MTALELTGLALREAVATALGWATFDWEDGWCGVHKYPSGEPYNGPHVHMPNGQHSWRDSVPAFDESLDACFAPGGPVERLRADGWWFGFDAEDSDRWTAWFSNDEVDSVWITGPSPAEAVCRAFLAAVSE